MALLQCEVLDGPREGFKTVGVTTIEGSTEYLIIEERFLVHQDDAYLLPVRQVHSDPVHKTVLVQLPVEADSGANRVWVRKDELIKAGEVPA
jgi:hypothetical protein